MFDPEAMLDIMHKKHITAAQLVEEICIEPRTLGEWLTGKTEPRQSSVKALSNLLRCKVSDLEI